MADAGNVRDPSLLAILSKHYQVCVEGDDDCQVWVAVRGSNRFSAADPLALLGLIALYEQRGAAWELSDEERPQLDAFYDQAFSE